MKEFKVAIVGASGAVGEEIISILESVDFKIKEQIWEKVKARCVDRKRNKVFLIGTIKYFV